MTGHQAIRPTGQQGHLIAFEGLDQSGKQTKAERLLAAFRDSGRNAEFLNFPDSNTATGAEIGRAQQGERRRGMGVQHQLVKTLGAPVGE